MSLLKIIIIGLIACFTLFALLLYYTLSPTIRNVSSYKQLTPFLNKPLRLERKALIYYLEEGQYRFYPHLLSENFTDPWEKQYELAAGSLVILKEFKTYKNAVSGFTHLYALGEYTAPAGQKIAFAYDWASVDQPGDLPVAIWQKDSASFIRFEKK